MPVTGERHRADYESLLPSLSTEVHTSTKSEELTPASRTLQLCTSDKLIDYGPLLPLVLLDALRS